MDGAGPEDGTGGAEGGELEAAASEEWKRGALPDGDAFWWRENADESDGVEISLVSPGEMKEFASLLGAIAVASAAFVVAGRRRGAARRSLPQSIAAERRRKALPQSDAADRGGIIAARERRRRA